jgi:hypothetical protein
LQSTINIQFETINVIGLLLAGSKTDCLNAQKKLASREKDFERIRKLEETCQQIINRAINIDFRRCESGYYAIELQFNGDFMGGISRFGEPLQYVAERVARDIQHQIASSKFIETARQNERRRMESDMRMQNDLGFGLGQKGWMENPHG